MHGRPTSHETEPLAEREKHDAVTTTTKPFRTRDVALALVAFHLLIGFLVFGSLHVQGAPASEERPSPLRTIDFNQPTTLAWSLQLMGLGSTALRDVKCTNRRTQVFICHGVSANGAVATVRIVVANNGASWTSQ